MKVIKSSAHIIEKELEGLSIYQRIDRCAAVCYQRPPKVTEEEAQEFCRKMVVSKHLATLEMAQVHLFIPFGIRDPFGNYLVNTIGRDGTIVSGSIRSFMEVHLNPSIRFMLSESFPTFFSGGGTRPPKIRFALPEEIPWQHKYVAVRFIVNRAVSHELVRHRPCSFLQESQRYCRYEDDVVFIRPEWAGALTTDAYVAWVTHMQSCETLYKELLLEQFKPQQARAVLPNSTKTELIVYASLPEWQHIFNLRCSPAADPEMRRVMVPLREEFKTEYQEVRW